MVLSAGADDTAGNLSAFLYKAAVSILIGTKFHVELQIEYGGECHISGRPYTVFRWRPGNDARYECNSLCA